MFLAVMLVCGLIAQTHVLNGQTQLTELMNYALEHSRDIKKSDLDIEQAGYMKKEALGHGLPQLEGKMDYSKMFLNLELPPQYTTYNPNEPAFTGLLSQLGNINALYTADVGVQVTQLIYSQSYWDGLKAAKKTKELYATLKTKTEEDVLEEVADNYYQALSLILQLRTVDKSLSNLKGVYRIVDLTYKNDLTKETNVNRLKVTLTNLDVTRQTLENSIGLQVNYLKVLAGIPNDSTFAIDTTALEKNLNINPATFPAFSADSVPAYQTLLKQDEIYQQQVKLAKAAYYPTLAAFGQLKYSSFNTSADISNLNNLSTIGLQLNIPIFTSGVQHAKVEQQKIKEMKLQEDLSNTKDLLNTGYNNALSEYQTAMGLLGARKDNRALALKVYNQTSLQYKEGMASMADLLNVNSDFLKADNSYNQQELKCKLAEIKVLKASGNLKQWVNNK